ncbi:MAG: sugar phosphate isomerase/epimerase [Armatimonadetes bacterium]|nr:sugar phosphate isomerase/epimerase [Armatimonadota bacterium]
MRNGTGSPPAERVRRNEREESRINLGICAYGLAYSCGFVGRNTARANPKQLTCFDLLDLAARLRLSSVEIPRGMAPGGDQRTTEALRSHAEALHLELVVAGGSVSVEALTEDMDFAQAVGASVVRCVLSGVLCGDRRSVGGLEGWRQILLKASVDLKAIAHIAEDMGLRLGVEDHQDATGEDLVWLCDRVDSPAVGITFDTGNPLAVCEDPVDFARRALPYLVNVHLKDYRLFGTPSGFRLVHCPIGAGVVNFTDLFALLEERPEVPRNIEMAALTARHIRLLDEDYWEGYPVRDVRSVLPVLRLWHDRQESGEWRTPWETSVEGELVEWELERLKESVARMRSLLESRREPEAPGNSLSEV